MQRPKTAGMIRQKVFVVDAFASGPFSGNPAGVCVYKTRTKLDDATLQRIAAEMNLSETCFCYPEGDGGYRLRWLTPTTEVPLCGHGTLATAHVLFNELEAPGPTLCFRTLSGELRVSRGADGELTMDFPRGQPVRVPALPEALLAQLCAALSIADFASVSEVHFCARTRKLALVVTSAAVVRACVPNGAHLESLVFPESLCVKGVMVTAASPDATFHFVSRYFAPWNGILEDPVTGSAHTVLAVLWSHKLGGLTCLRGFQCSARGGAMGMTLPQGSDRVLLSGVALTMMRGRMEFASSSSSSSSSQ